MSYLIRRILAKPRLILDEMCRLYGKFASYLRRVLCKTRLIFPRINGPIIIAVFLIFIQLCDSRKIHYLTREFHAKLHLKTDIARIANFRVQFNVEFPRQVMNFPIVSSAYM